MTEKTILPDSPLNILATLAKYEGPWRPLRQEAERLQIRLDELSRRQQIASDVLVAVLLGGSGVGKSTLLNALAGDELAPVSEMRPCTSVPTVYHPPGITLPFDGWNMVAGSALERLVLIDTPDSDTIVKEHRALVEEALQYCDLVLVCGSPEKYLDEATWSLLTPRKESCRIVCVETKASEASSSIRQHWLDRLEKESIKIEGYFRVNALHALDEKLGLASGKNLFDFARLEAFLYKELTREYVRRIKRSNTLGLLQKTIRELREQVEPCEKQLYELQGTLQDARQRLTDTVMEVVKVQIFQEPHLWVDALSREISCRARGLMGTVFRILEIIRTLPTRLTGLFPGNTRAALQNAVLLKENPDTSIALYKELNTVFAQYQGEIALAMAHAGFELPDPQQSQDVFQKYTQSLLDTLLRKMARKYIIRYARFMTSWPVTILLDAFPVLFIGYSGYYIVREFLTGHLLPVAYFVHTGIMLLLLCVLETAGMRGLIRLFSWQARRKTVKFLRHFFTSNEQLFRDELNAVKTVCAYIRHIKDLQV